MIAAVAVVLGSLAGVAGSASAEVEANAEPPADGDVAALTEAVLASDEAPGLSGDEAVSALEETDTTEIAAANAGLEAVELVEELQEDPGMFVTGDAMVGYVEVADASSLDAETDGAEALAPAGCANPFQLDSLPTSKKVIYLDFNGHTTTDQPWNTEFAVPAGAPIVSAAYAGGSSAICEIWRRVAEDYLPFGVNVTTRDPGVDGLRKTSSGDGSYGQRMVVTPSNFTGSGSTLGIALLNVFDHSQDFSAFVFASSLSPRNVAEAISHEAGHTLGLHHDGTSGAPYYSGHNGWAPLMGSPLNKSVTQWSKGEYPDANNGEDDIAKIASYTGYRADDIANSRANATVLTCKSSYQGVIGAGGDRDVFAVDVGTGQLTVTVRPDEAWGNLHASVTLRNSGGGVVDTATPGAISSWTSTASFNVPAAGRYYIEVAPTAWQTPATGFTVYGSMGAYDLTIAGQAAQPSACASRLTSVTPNRVLDTRHGIGGTRRVSGGNQAVVQITGTKGVPHGATAAVVNITAVGPSGSGFLTAYPCSSTVPDASNVNYVAGQTVSNSTIAALSSSGQLCVWTFADTDILVDVTGWLGASGASKLTQTGPHRVVDTRRAHGGTRIGAGGTLQVDFSGSVPAGTTAVSFNITAVGASEAAFMTAYPCGQSRPETSVVNYGIGEARPNNVIVGLGGGKVCIYSYAASEVIVDLTGYFSPTGALAYQPVAPKRVLDTRGGVVRPPVVAGTVLNYSVNVAGLGGLDPDAAFVNVTAVDHPREGFVTTYDCSRLPDASTVNQRVGQANANGAIVPLTSSSRSCAWLSDAGHLIVDLNGWWVR